MQTLCSVRSVVIFGLAFLATVIFVPRPTFADSVTFAGPTSNTITEDGAVHTVLYTLTNNSGGDLTRIGIGGAFAVGPVSGDFSDNGEFAYGEFGLPGNCDVTTPLASGSSCTMALILYARNGAGETDADSGTQSVTLGASFSLPSGAQGSEVLSVLITTKDLTGVPEPSSLLLFGPGLLGVLCAAGWKRRHALSFDGWL